MIERRPGMWWGAAIEAPNPGELARFYSDLLGWPVVHEEEGTAVLGTPGGMTFMVFQRADGYVPPVWPPGPGDQRPMMHLDFQVADLEASVAAAVGLGASVANSQPNPNVRVMVDPVGHPFCLCLDE